MAVSAWMRWARAMSRADAEGAAMALIDRFYQLQDDKALARMQDLCDRLRAHLVDAKKPKQKFRPRMSATRTDAIRESEQRRTSRGGLVLEEAETAFDAAAAVRSALVGGRT